jgi:hypothetical protein
MISLESNIMATQFSDKGKWSIPENGSQILLYKNDNSLKYLTINNDGPAMVVVRAGDSQTHLLPGSSMFVMLSEATDLTVAPQNADASGTWALVIPAAREGGNNGAESKLVAPEIPRSGAESRPGITTSGASTQPGRGRFS